MMRQRWAVGCGLALVACAACAATAQAADARIDVVDAQGACVAGAQVFVVERGTLVALGRTGPDGRLAVPLRAGQLLVARSGSRSTVPARFTGEPMRLALPVATIGMVRARNSDPGEKTIGAESDAAVVFDDVALARSLVPNYRSRAEGGSGHQTLNGVPLDLPAGPRGGGGDDPGVPSDLIDSFSTTQADDGSVTPNYHLLAPTPAFAARVTSGIAAHDGSLWKAGFSGTSHGLGFALGSAVGADQGALAGATLRDASGLTYDHSTHAQHVDLSLALTHAIGSTHLSVAGFTSRRSAADVDPTLPGSVLAGIGPDNRTTRTSTFGYAMATQTHGRDSYHAIGALFAGGSADDAPNATLAGIAAGYAAGYRYSGGYDELSFTRAYGAGSLSLKTTLTQTATTGYVTTAGFASQTPAQAGQSTVGVEYEHHAGPGAYGFSADRLQRDGTFSGGMLEARAHLKLALAGTIAQFAFSHGQSQTQEAYSAAAYDLSAPTAATVTCATPSATVVGPSGALGGHPEADTLDVRLHRDLPGGVAVSAGGFLSSARDGLVFPAAQLGGALDPAYRARIAADFDLLCPGQSLRPSDIFVQRYETVPRLLGREWFVDGTVPFGPFRAEATYETFSQFAPEAPADLAGIASTLVPGAQLPGVPLHRANLLLAYHQRRLVVAGALQYTSANNVDALPGHVTVALGAQVPVGPGTLAMSAQNLFHAYGGTDVGPRYAVPIATTAGWLPTLAVPLRPMWSLRYTLPVASLVTSHR